MKAYRNEAGDLHRVNGPALEYKVGAYAWCYDGRIHRYYGPACHYYHEYDNEYWIYGEKLK